MKPESPSPILSRERAAGYDPARLRTARVLVVGAGAVGSNVLQTLGLLGVQAAIVDMDEIDASGLTRSPLVRPGDTGKGKAETVARSMVALSPFSEMRAWYSAEPIERIGFGAFDQVDVVVAAVDSLAGRAYLAETTRELGIPLIESGFEESLVHISMWPNTSADEPCFRCLHPSASAARASCNLYARATVQAGFLPAIQSAAAVVANLAAEAAIQALHGAYPLSNSYLELDVRSGRSLRFTVTRRQTCGAAHRRSPLPLDTTVPVGATVFEFLEHIALGRDARLILREPFVVSAPCARCGHPVDVMCSLALARTPVCNICPTENVAHAPMNLVHEVAIDDALAKLPLSVFGFASRDLVEIDHGEERFVFRLDGTERDLFQLVSVTDADETAWK